MKNSSKNTVKHLASLVKHPQMNGQVEAANKAIPSLPFQYQKIGQHTTFIQVMLKAPSTSIAKVLFDQVVRSGWMSPIWTYLIKNILPSEELEAKNVKLQASHYVIVNMKCLEEESQDPC